MRFAVFQVARADEIAGYAAVVEYEIAQLPDRQRRVVKEIAHVLRILDHAVSVVLPLGLILREARPESRRIAEISPRKDFGEEVSVLDCKPRAVGGVRGGRMNGVAEKRRSAFRPGL